LTAQSAGATAWTWRLNPASPAPSAQQQPATAPNERSQDDDDQQRTQQRVHFCLPLLNGIDWILAILAIAATTAIRPKPAPKASAETTQNSQAPAPRGKGQ